MGFDRIGRRIKPWLKRSSILCKATVAPVSWVAILEPEDRRRDVRRHVLERLKLLRKPTTDAPVEKHSGEWRFFAFFEGSGTPCPPECPPPCPTPPRTRVWGGRYRGDWGEGKTHPRRLAWLKNRDPAKWRDAWKLEHVLGKYIISDRPMTEEEWIRERATVIDVTPEQ
jgi:hypothetical protein